MPRGYILPPPPAASLHCLVLSNCRYLENLEPQLAEQSRLQTRVKELETRLLALEPGTQPSRSSSAQQFLTPPEVSSATNRYLSPGLETSYNQWLVRAFQAIRTRLSIMVLDCKTKKTIPILESSRLARLARVGTLARHREVLPLAHNLIDNSDIHEFHQKRRLIWYGRFRITFLTSSPRY
jgi:hypothetical protein